ncbi:hypothetical protein BJX61DRAFT_542330 [Aspergillus egyptiacus]|nr:hypothetical protein BJX61DRAFT_542330 [Aspergillus egyptiacus]
MAEEEGTPEAWRDFISREPLFQELHELKAKGWANPAGDTYFNERAKKAKKTDWQTRKSFYRMTKEIGHQLAIGSCQE